LLKFHDGKQESALLIQQEMDNGTFFCIDANDVDGEPVDFDIWGSDFSSARYLSV
jgi:hypothetical protein